LSHIHQVKAKPFIRTNQFGILFVHKTAAIKLPRSPQIHYTVKSTMAYSYIFVENKKMCDKYPDPHLNGMWQMEGKRNAKGGWWLRIRHIWERNGS